jgi:hypothetical protein
MKRILKKTPIHCVVKISRFGGGDAHTETIDLDTDLVVTPEVPTVDAKVNIDAIHFSIPSGTATITRGGQILWAFTGVYSLKFDGFAENTSNGSDIVVSIPGGGGTVVLELKKIAGYGDEQHRNPPIS